MRSVCLPSKGGERCADLSLFINLCLGQLQGKEGSHRRQQAHVKDAAIGVEHIDVQEELPGLALLQLQLLSLQSPAQEDFLHLDMVRARPVKPAVQATWQLSSACP